MAQPRERVRIAEYEAFLRLPDHRSRRFELIDGEIAEKMPAQKHADVV